MRQYFVYMLLCGDGKYYVGVTNDVEHRFAEHQEGLDPGAWTHGRGPFELVYVQEFQWVQEAIEWEKRLKGWSAKKKKALCAENYDAYRSSPSAVMRPDMIGQRGKMTF